MQAKYAFATFVIFFFAATTASTAHAQGQEVIASVPADEVTCYLNDNGTKSIVTDIDGTPALQVDVEKKGDNPWRTMCLSPTNVRPVKKGDILAVSIRIRITGDRTDLGDVGVQVESAVKEKKFSSGPRIYPTTELQTFRRTTVCEQDFEPGELRVSIHLAAKPQTVQLSSLSVESFPEGTPADKLQIDEITWKGRSLDAEWRKAAHARIDQLRKCNLSIEVIDAEGNPVEDAVVNVNQKKHHWRFGTFVGRELLEDSESGKRYRAEVLKRNNFLTLPAYLANWGWRDEANRIAYFQLADWAQTHAIEARGHLLVYPGWTATPEEWFTIPKPELMQKMSAHIPVAIAAFRSRGVTEWDVVNELRYNQEFMEELGGVQKAAEWFQLAKKFEPTGKLYLNETGILPNGDHTETEQRILEEHFKTLVAHGASIDGIGLQGHFRDELTPPVKLLEILDRISKLTGEIMITEFDMDNDDKRAQGDYVRDFYTACFSHPNVKGIVQWGFWEGDMWKPRGHFLTRDWSETPVSKAYDQLVFEQWWTNESSDTDEAGQSVIRVFQGIQTVTVQHGQYSWTRDIELISDKLIRVTVP